MKNNYPNLIDVGSCNLHIVHDAFGKSLEAYGSNIESLLIDIYYYFKQSAVRSEDLNDMQAKLGFTEHIFLRHVENRWLTINSSINRVIEQFDVLYKYFSTQSHVQSARAKKIAVFFSEQSLLSELLFLRNASAAFQRSSWGDL